MKKNYKKLSGAGVVPVFNNLKGIYSDLSKDVLFLVLIKKNGEYDFPKGQIEKDIGEDPFTAALREMDEECNLKFEDFVDLKKETEFIYGDNLAMYFGELSNISNVKIKPNPKFLEKGITLLEHQGFKFLKYEEAKENLLHYLVPSIEKANEWFKNK